MRVVMLSSDRNILNPETDAAKRVTSYGVFANMTFVVFGKGQEDEVELTPSVRVIAAGGANPFDAYIRLFKTLFETTEEKPDLISSQDPFFAGLAALLVARVRNVPLQVQLHTDCFSTGYMFESPRRFLEVVCAFFVLSGASCIRVVSGRLKKSLTHIDVPVSVLPIRVEDRSAESFEKPASVSGGFTVLAISRLTHEKRLEVVLEALARTKDINLVILGDGPEKSRLMKRAENLGISQKVRFDLWAPAWPYLTHANAFVQVSRYEGYGRTLIEAALAGLPIVTTDVGVVGEVLEKDADALVVPALPEAVAQAFLELRQNPLKAAALGRSARKKAAASLVSEEEYARRYHISLRSCL